MTGGATPSAPGGLASLDGAAPPAELTDALRRAMALPDAARSTFTELMVACMESVPEDQLDARIVRLCRRADLDPESLAPPVKASRFLLRSAARNNVAPPRLAEDLVHVCGEGETVSAMLVPIYQSVFADLRKEVIRSALATHGRVLAGVEWRVDTIGSTSQGRELGIPIALLTLHYHDGAKVERVTVQALPDQVAELRRACDELLRR